LAAGITLAREGLAVLLVEAHAQIGGGTRTAELTLPGFHHDLCSAVHPMGVASPFMRSLPLEKFGLEWIHPEVILAHPLEGGRGALLVQNLERTCEGLPGRDGRAWRRLFQGLQSALPGLWDDLLGPLPLPPQHPLRMAQFGLPALRSARGLAQSRFQSDEARALFAGNAAHSVLPLESMLTGAVGMALCLAAHGTGWPVAKSGSHAITLAMARYFEALGGEIICNWRVDSLAELPTHDAVLFDTGPHQTATIAGDALPAAYRRRLQAFRYGPASFKIDLALREPIPWTYAPARRAGTVHVGGTMDEVCASERACWTAAASENPFVLVAQQSVCDATRAPVGRHTAWLYCHVPHASTADMTEPLLRQIERFAPGFRDTILAQHVMRPADLAAYNLNNVGGDIVGGVMDATQLFTRPVRRWNPFTTPSPKIFHCSSSTPPGGGVHGMCGWHAARTVLRRRFDRRIAMDEPTSRSDS
jgi:phytoene dehydrogenase-like protein